MTDFGELHLFAQRLIQHDILSTRKAIETWHSCNKTSDMIVFGEALLQQVPEKFEQVQVLVEATEEDYAAGLRADANPFETSPMEAPASPQMPPPPQAPPSTTPTPEPAASKPNALALKLPTRVSEPEVEETPPPASEESAPTPNGPKPEQPPAPQPESLPDSAPASPGKCPPEIVVPAGQARPAIPDFSRLNPEDTSQVAAALIGLLMALGQQDFSDLHLSAGARPYGRRFGQVEFLAETPLSRALAQSLGTALLSPAQLAYFEEFQDYDFAIALDNGRRYRTNLMQHRDGLKITFRLVPHQIRPLDSLGFGSHVETLKNLLSFHNGLILLTGPVGCGKTTTLAAMVDELNRTRSDHIICVEDPIEILHRSSQCAVTQRGVGPHTDSFRSALKGALRQDPDIIVIGDMRDLETIEMAISASETGHLVIGTMHTSDAGMTLNRLLDVFPPAAQPQIRAMVAESLRGIVCQRLLPGTNGQCVLACEILIKNLAVAALIREGKQQGLGNIMETGKREGMVQMDACVLQRYQEGALSADVARANIRNEIIRRNVS